LLTKVEVLGNMKQTFSFNFKFQLYIIIILSPLLETFIGFRTRDRIGKKNSSSKLNEF